MSRKHLFVCGLFLSVLTPLGTVRAEPPALDPIFVGHWTGTFQVPNVGLVKWTSDIAPNGTYVMLPIGPGILPGESGIFEAAGGTWLIRATNGRAEAGTYTFNGPNMVTFDSPLGTSLWTRELSKPVQAPLPPLAYDPRAVLWNEALPAAWVEARVWRKDATLVEVRVETPGDGRADLFRNPAAIIYVFYSPEFRETLHALPTPDRTIALRPFPGPAALPTLPIGGPVLDLRTALARARREGLASPLVLAVLHGPLAGTAPGAGREDRAKWLLNGVGGFERLVYDASGPAAGPAEGLVDLGPARPAPEREPERTSRVPPPPPVPPRGVPY